jgi:hypothetical protein
MPRTDLARQLRLAAATTAVLALACTACTSKGSTTGGSATGSATGTSTSSTTGPATAPAPGTSSGTGQASASGPSASGASSDPSASPAGSDGPATPPPDPASVHANELGLVPVMMYHRLVAHAASDYERTPAEFESDLTFLEKNHFYPVTATDFVAGTIDIPAGDHPVVLTFDDGTTSQFALDADGKPKAGTAVAILEAFAAAHPDFPAVATFYVNQAPFGSKDGEQVLAWLHSHGFEVGVHTVHHLDLSTLTDAKVQSEIADNVKMIETAIPGYTPTTFALPFGSIPKDRALATSGSADGTTYHLAGVFAVGAGPSHSPYNAAFKASYIPRIRAEDQAQAKASDRPYISSSILPSLVSNTAELYTSDGDPKHVSYPKTTTIQVAPQWKSEAQPY